MQILTDAPLFPRADFQNRFLETLALGNVESHAVDEPGPSILPANHLRFALKPEHSSIARHDAVRRAQRFTRKEHLSSFYSPSHLVIGMNLLIPPHRVLQPFALRKTERSFNLRAYVGFA